MTKFVITYGALMISLAAGCTPVAGDLFTPSPVRNVTQIIPSQTIQLSPAVTATVEPSSFPTPTPTASVLQTETSTIVKQRCLSISDTIPEGFLSGGSIVFWSQSGLYTLNSADKRLQLVPNSSIAGPDAKVSPNGRLLAFQTIETNQETNTSKPRLWLTAVDQPTSDPTSLTLNREWSGIVGWLDNDTLLLSPANRPRGTLLLFNRVDGQIRELVPSFPNPYFGTDEHADPGPSWDVVYDPTLTRAIYLKLANADGFPAVTLWDLNNGKALWELGHPKAFDALVEPTWSINGEQFVVAGQKFTLNELMSNNQLLSESHFELFIVNRDGHINQSTSYSNGYDSIHIERLSWSPNGQYISFWMQFNNKGDLHLVLYNTTDQQTTDYCIPNGGFAPTPLWSPDSKQLIVVRENSGKRQLVVVDVVHNTAVNVSNSVGPELSNLVQPVGWMDTTR